MRDAILRAVRGWSGAALLFAGPATGAVAQPACELDHSTVCELMDESWQFYCRKRVIQVRALCRKAHGTERFGTHREQCAVSCRARLLAGELDHHLRNEAMNAVGKRGKDDTQWRRRAGAFWEAFAAASDTCTSADLRKAHKACTTLCDTEFARRDVAELQALTKGKPRLPVIQPEFACAPSPALGLFVAPNTALMEQLFPPGHARRSDKQ